MRQNGLCAGRHTGGDEAHHSRVFHQRDEGAKSTGVHAKISAALARECERTASIPAANGEGMRSVQRVAVAVGRMPAPKSDHRTTDPSPQLRTPPIRGSANMIVPLRLLPAAMLLNVLGALVTTSIAAQSAPPARAHHSLAYDPERQRVVLTGGSTPRDSGRSFVFFDDVWEFDGSRWRALPSSGRRVSGVGLAFDSRAKRLTSFGGYSDGAAIAEMRILVGNAWETVGQHPEVRAAEPGFVYDRRRNRFVTFGGGGGRFQTHGDTWEFDGAIWTKHASKSPAARQ